MPEKYDMPNEAALRDAYNAGVEASAAGFDRLAAETEEMIDIALQGAHMQNFYERVLGFRLHAARIRKLKQSE
jgi:hypothetical protein